MEGKRAGKWAVVLLVLLSAPVNCVAQEWAKGTVVEVVASPEGQYTDYVIRTATAQITLRPDPAMGKPAKAVSKVNRVLKWPWLEPKPVRVVVPANVGDAAEVQPFGDRAWLKVRGQQFACSIMRQILVAEPNPPEQQASRPTLKREE